MSRAAHQPAETAHAVRPRIGFIGAGRAGNAMAAALAEAGYSIATVFSRSPHSAAGLAAATGAEAVGSAVAAVRGADLTFLTVPDSQVPRIAATIAASGMALGGRGIVHCCASRGREALAALRLSTAAVGAVHPLQALAGAGSAPLLRGSLFAVDVDAVLDAVVHGLVADLGGESITIDAGVRARYHAAASLAGNAPLALLARAADQLVALGVDRTEATRGLAHLMAGAATNAARTGNAAEALTGPVVRGDAATVDAHIAALGAADAATRDLYVRMARALLDLVGPAGRGDVVDVVNAAEGAPHPRLRRRGSAA